MGGFAIGGTLLTGISFAFVQIYVKYSNPEFALTHWFNELSYYVKNSFVLLIVAAIFLIRPNKTLVFTMMWVSIVLTAVLKLSHPEMNYFVRSMWVILGTVSAVALPTWKKNGWRIPLSELVESSNRKVAGFGVALGASLVLSHIVFH
jgi:SSS family solute:Na+ symporter